MAHKDQEARMIKTLFFASMCAFLLFLSVPVDVFATSSYVLPYPSIMPGSTVYLLDKVWERINQWWYFGDFAQATYYRHLSDKYLVEVKTLFEYGQYKLGLVALEKSNTFFLLARQFLRRAGKSKKNISEKEVLFREEALKHTEVLKTITASAPEEIVWSQEHESPVTLTLNKSLVNAVTMRKTR